MANVPDTYTFSLQDVVDSVNPTTDDLVDSFDDSNEYYFDPDYVGTYNDMKEFRNYGLIREVDVESGDFNFDWDDTTPRIYDVRVRPTNKVTTVTKSDTWLSATYNSVNKELTITCTVNSSGTLRNTWVKLTHPDDSGVYDQFTVVQTQEPI